MPDAIPVRLTTDDRLPVMASVLGRAFVRDPMILWPMAEAPDMEARVARHFATIYRDFMERGTMWEAGDGAGFAHWVPPGGAGKALETTDAIMVALRELTDDGGARYEVLWEWVEARVPADVMYLDAIGVDPSQQGRGAGTALMRVGLERARELDVDAFLETAVEANIAYYERFGFEVIEDGAIADGPHIWFMRTTGGAGR
jgi:GNAT superfamily N-acetyltransferase